MFLRIKLCTHFQLNSSNNPQRLICHKTRTTYQPTYFFTAHIKVKVNMNISWLMEVLIYCDFSHVFMYRFLLKNKHAKQMNVALSDWNSRIRLLHLCRVKEPLMNVLVIALNHQIIRLQSKGFEVCKVPLQLFWLGVIVSVMVLSTQNIQSFTLLRMSKQNRNPLTVRKRMIIIKLDRNTW